MLASCRKLVAQRRSQVIWRGLSQTGKDGDDQVVLSRFVPNMDSSTETVRSELTIEGKWRQSNVAFYLDNVFSPLECEALIQRSEDQGYEQALVNIGRGKQMEILETRLSHRCIIDDEELADAIWQRIKHHVPQTVRSGFYPNKMMYAVGLNERLRILKYDEAGYFKMHRDGSYFRPKDHMFAGDHSLLTVLWNLNSPLEFEGCRTRLFDDSKKFALELEPSVGGILVFSHNILHSASELISGVKYILRTDIMFSESRK